MPNIVDYSPRIQAQQPSDRASEAHVTGGRRIAQQYNEAGAAMQLFGHQLGEAVSSTGRAYVDYQAHKEISAGGLGASALMLNATNGWAATLKGADANDPSLQGKFMDNLEGKLQAFRDSFTTEHGREWADARINHIREHFANVTTADSSTIAGVAAHNNFIQSNNMRVATVDSDPTAIHAAADQLKDDVNHLSQSPNMKGVAAVKFQTDATQHGMEQLVKAAVRADIRRGGDGKWISDDPRYAPYVNAQERQEFVMDQRREERYAKADDRAQKQFEKEEQQHKNDETLKSVFLELNRTDGQKPNVSRETINEALRTGQLTERGAEHAMTLLSAVGKKGTLTAGEAEKNAIGLIVGIHNGKITDMDAAYKALDAGEIDMPRFNQVRKEFDDMRSPEGNVLGQERAKFLNSYSHVVNPINQAGNRLNFEREYSLYAYARQREGEMRQAGKNPHDLYDPTKPDFVGKTPAAQPLSPFELMQQQIRFNVDSSASPLKAPDKPKWLTDSEFGKDAVWDAQRKAWTVTRDGKVKIIRE